MKKFFTILFLLVNSFINCSQRASVPEPTGSFDIISDQIIYSVSKRLSKEFGLILVGIGGSVDKEGIRSLSASFEKRSIKNLNINEIREMVLRSITEFLKEADSNKEFKKLVKEYPFTAKNISLTIVFNDELGKTIHYPSISFITLRSGEINYVSFGPTLYDPYSQKIIETYEEALEHSKLNSK